MQTKIGVIQTSKFEVSNYSESVQNAFTDIKHRNTDYKYLFAFDCHIDGYQFDHVFNNVEEYEVWLVYVPNEITKLQCVEQLRIDNKYNELMTALKIDATGWDMIRWEAAAVLARDSQMVAKLAGALSMTSDDVDTFFINASNIYL